VGEARGTLRIDADSVIVEGVAVEPGRVAVTLEP
jgi:hypothetical protein